MPIYETGHARNIQHFQEMNTFIAGWGAQYNPTNTAILLTALQTKLTNADATMDAVSGAVAQVKAAINARETTFAGLRKLTTRIVNYYDSTGTEKNNVDDVRSLKKKIDGKRAKQVVDDPATPEDESANSISTHGDVEADQQAESRGACPEE